MASTKASGSRMGVACARNTRSQCGWSRMNGGHSRGDPCYQQGGLPRSWRLLVQTPNKDFFSSEPLEVFEQRSEVNDCSFVCLFVSQIILVMY